MELNNKKRRLAVQPVNKHDRKFLEHFKCLQMFRKMQLR